MGRQHLSGARDPFWTSSSFREVTRYEAFAEIVMDRGSSGSGPNVFAARDVSQNLCRVHSAPADIAKRERIGRSDCSTGRSPLHVGSLRRSCGRRGCFGVGKDAIHPFRLLTQNEPAEFRNPWLRQPLLCWLGVEVHSCPRHAHPAPCWNFLPIISTHLSKDRRGVARRLPRRNRRLSILMLTRLRWQSTPHLPEKRAQW